MTEEKKDDKKIEEVAIEDKKPTSVKAIADKEEKKVEVEKKEEEEDAVEVPEKFAKLVEGIEKMSVLDLAELVKILEKKFGVSASAQASAQVIAAAPVVGGGENEEAVEEKSIFNIELTAVGDKKIEVIKAVRDITQKGLKESKDIVDAAMTSPQIIKENVKKEEAQELKKQFEAAGAKVELK